MVDPDILRLVQVCMRTFYEAKYIIVMDQLIRKEAMRDEELAARVGLTTKDVAKLANKLAEDGILATHRRAELRPGAMKASSRTWYFIDYQRTIDNIKWRMFKIRKVIDDKLRNELDSQGYVCPKCKKRFSTLDAGALFDPFENAMRCDICNTDVVDNENVEDVKRSKDQMNRLLDQTSTIVDGLKKTEKIRLPAFNMAAWLEKHHPVAAIDLLPTASGSGPAKVTIELIDNPDELEIRRKKEAEAESTRQQNALPSWIEKSTITGELTAAGAAQANGTSLGDGQASYEVHHGVASPQKTTNAATNTIDDDVDSYYAALAAAQSAIAISSSSKSTSLMKKESSVDDGTSTQHGSPSSGLAANSKLVDSGYEEFGDENYSVLSPASPASNRLSPSAGLRATTELNRPSPLIPSLRPPSAASFSNNSLGKRSREASEESEADQKAKTVIPDVILPEETPIPATLLDEEEEGDTIIDDPILTVAGKEMPFSTITEEMAAEMTPEEYILWWETMGTI